MIELFNCKGSLVTPCSSVLRSYMLPLCLLLLLFFPLRWTCNLSFHTQGTAPKTTHAESTLIKYILLFSSITDFVSLHFSDLRWKEGERSLNEESHQPFGVEDELVSACLFIPVTHSI